MPLIIPPGYAQLTLNFMHNASTRLWSVTCGLDVSEYDGAYLAAVQIGALAFRTGGGITDLMDSDVQLTTATLAVGQDGGDPIHVEQTYNEPGGRSLAAAPANTALLVRKTTELGGRRGRGRFYFPAVIGDGEISDIGVLDGGFVVDAQEKLDYAYGILITGNSGGQPTLPPVVLHHSEGAGTEPVPTPIVHFDVQALAATQRRRMRG